MENKSGVYRTTKKDGSVYYRSSLTYKRKHISLGSFSNEDDATKAYREGREILDNASLRFSEYGSGLLSYEKAVILFNFRDNGIYFHNPIYVFKTHFSYYLTKDDIYTFDLDDLFYYASHKLMRRGGHLFVSDYGMQISILSRYGIQPFAVSGRDYEFRNGDPYDLRYANVICKNPYHGVRIVTKNGIPMYRAMIHYNGDTIIGTYKTALEAAIAYNKAVDLLKKQGYSKNYNINYIEGLGPKDYAEIYAGIAVSKSILSFSASRNPRNS
ncbi:MAG: hypothetical protein K6G07_07175 [Lachnospiraceae bacterium]|nr:hypothetical protein [Lachnospiraceae bacterium]